MRDCECDWVIRIHEKLKTVLAAKDIHARPWYGSISIMNCHGCKVERGCCKKKKLTLTSQILDWLKQHQEELNSINTEEQRILVYYGNQH